MHPAMSNIVLVVQAESVKVLIGGTGTVFLKVESNLASLAIERTTQCVERLVPGSVMGQGTGD